jgi:hypothetical protein
MAQRKELEIKIGPDGDVKITVKGSPGESCLQETAFLEHALGTVKDRELTAEYYQQEQGDSVTTRD